MKIFFVECAIKWRQGNKSTLLVEYHPLSSASIFTLNAVTVALDFPTFMFYAL